MSSLLPLLPIVSLLLQQPGASTPPAQTPLAPAAPAPSSAAASGPATPEVPMLDAKLGACSADFTVTDAGGAPIYDARIHVRIRYGPLAVKRMDLEIGTNSDGRARLAGLPPRARPLVYDITKGTLKSTAGQELVKTCAGVFAVTLK